MSLVDNDLLSIQEARILLERAEETRAVLEGLPGTLIDGFLHELASQLKPCCEKFAQQAFEESDYGCAADEQALTEWVLTDLLDDVCTQTPPLEIYSRESTHSAEVGLSKGLVFSLLPDWIAVPTMISQLVCAVTSRSPIIFSARPRIHATCEAVMEQVREIARACHYPADALGYLCLYAHEGEAWLARQPQVRMLIDSRECEHLDLGDITGKDVYHASIGNNPVFVEQTADLAHCAEEIVLGKSFCFGMMPGAEQSVVVEEAVDEVFKAELKSRGCYFLSDEECQRLLHVCFREDGRAYRELIGKSACDLARRADIVVPDDTRVLVAEKPYVSERSYFSRTKYGPVLSYYVEDNWRDACEKCIELILNSGSGNALSIFSRDGEVVRQFILKKPVGRILVNVGTAMGSTGCHSTLPKTLTVAGWESATTSNLGVTYRDFIRRRQVGCGFESFDLSLLEAAGLNRAPERMGLDHTCTDHTSDQQESGDAHGQSWFASLLEDMNDC